jgi:Fuc2NAc and GlcNAc transferase
MKASPFEILGAIDIVSISAASLILGAAGAWVAGKYARKIGLMDWPLRRSSHNDPTPKGGGIGIFVVFLSSSIYFGIPASFWLPIGILSLIAFMGDQRALSPKLRLFIQLIISTYIVIGNKNIPLNFLGNVILTLFWIIFIMGTTNFYNFMDGINGIAGMTGIIGFSFLAVYIYSQYGHNHLSFLSASIALSCFGFLPLNIPKARVFMGDIGSILLGCTFGSLVFLSTKSFLDFLCMVSFLFPFYADELTTMFIRIKDGENLTKAHRRHLYQILANEKGIPHWRVSAAFGLGQMLIGFCAFYLKNYGSLAVLAFLFSSFAAFVFVSFYLRSRI